jgi:hypothetical protein
MPLRVPDLLADLRPGARRWRPAVGVPLHPADQRVPLERIDKTVVGELRHEHLGHMLQRRADLQGPGELLTDRVHDVARQDPGQPRSAGSCRNCARRRAHSGSPHRTSIRAWSSCRAASYSPQLHARQRSDGSQLKAPAPWSQAGEPSSANMRPHRATQLQSAISTDSKFLLRIEGVWGSNPLSPPSTGVNARDHVRALDSDIDSL